MDIEDDVQDSNQDNLADQLKIANDLKIHQDNLSWTTFSIFWAANALLLVALFQNSDSNLIQLKEIIVVFSGVILSIIWCFVEYRVIKFYLFYEDLVSRLEEERKINKNFRTGKDNEKYYCKFLSKEDWKSVMYILPIIGAICWLIIGLLLWIIYVICH